MTPYGGIEAGGSKWECAIGTNPDDVRAAETIRTTAPRETLDRAIAFFEREGPVEAVGIGSFGPIDQNRHRRLGVTSPRRRNPAGRTPTSARSSAAGCRCPSRSTRT
jgi:predicted NBD/HSP70 family sugar kinase